MSGRLPIHDIEGQIVSGLRESNRMVLTAPTGSGKSTQLPQILLSSGLAGDGQIVILQPRRLATRLLAKRVAEELGAPLGREVGYQIRLENVASAATRIKFVTEGVLLRQMLDNPELRGVSAVVFDEFHERHLYGDVTLARATDLQERSRSDLRIVVMSATLDAGKLEKYLRPCTMLSTEGRTFPVEIEYTNTSVRLEEAPVWDLAADAFAKCAHRADVGDVLIFMPGSYEIRRTLESLRECSESRGFILLPLHGELSPRDQDAAVARYDQPKVVVATNIAETSLTIDGVRTVIDSGLARIPKHDPWRGINTLLVERISRASADQRAGRAGRTASGRCVRLWSKSQHAYLPIDPLPEVLRLDLSEVVLTLKAAGVEDLLSFRWLDSPGSHGLELAESLLADLGALEVLPESEPSDDSGEVVMLDSEGLPVPGSPLESQPEAETKYFESSGTKSRITPLGRTMVQFPVHPRYARLLLAAREYGCVYHAALIAALTQGRDLLIRNVDPAAARLRDERLGASGPSDFLRRIRAWEYAAANNFQFEACERVGIHAMAARQVGPILSRFLDIAERAGMDVTPGEPDAAKLGRCILAAFADHLSRRLDAGTLRCEMVHGRRGVLARESVVRKHQLFVAAEVGEIGDWEGEPMTLFSLASAVDASWLEELFPDDLKKHLLVYFDPSARRVLAEEQRVFRGLAIEARHVEPPPVEAAARLLATEVLAGRLPLAGWDHAVEQWVLRLNCLTRWCPELGLPPLSEEDRKELIAQICHGAFGYKDIKSRPVAPFVRGWLSSDQQSLVEKHAPERLELRNGRRPKVSYVADGPPFIALRIQELYDVTETPRIAMARVPVTVHILAPNMRDVQVTQDLESFWRDHYPGLKSQLQRKYPKHEWR